MKKWVSVFLMVGLILFFAGCSPQEGEPPDNSSLSEETLPSDYNESTTKPEPVEEKKETTAIEVLNKLLGYWIKENENKVIELKLNNIVYEYRHFGWGSDGYRMLPGELSDLKLIPNNRITFTVHFHSEPWNELTGGWDEHWMDVTVDYSQIESQKKIKVKFPNTNWEEYVFTGKTADESHQYFNDNLDKYTLYNN